MKDRVRVTVIATGFGDEDKRLSSLSTAHAVTGAGTSEPGPQSDSSGYDKKLDIPTFTRNKSKESPTDTVKLKKISVIAQGEEEDKYEIPTFLRRQVD